jgi:hypothetical protein
MFELQKIHVPLHLGLHLATIVAFSSHMITKDGRESVSPRRIM